MSGPNSSFSPHEKTQSTRKMELTSNNNWNSPLKQDAKKEQDIDKPIQDEPKGTKQDNVSQSSEKAVVSGSDTK